MIKNKHTKKCAKPAKAHRTKKQRPLGNPPRAPYAFELIRAIEQKYKSVPANQKIHNKFTPRLKGFVFHLSNI